MGERLCVEVERENDGRWLAEVRELPGVLADRLEQGRAGASARGAVPGRVTAWPASKASLRAIERAMETGRAIRSNVRAHTALIAAARNLLLIEQRWPEVPALPGTGVAPGGGPAAGAADLPLGLPGRRFSGATDRGGGRSDLAGGLKLLSRREREILSALLSGQRVSIIARTHYVSPHTVRSHVKAIFRKLGVHSQVELLGRLLPAGFHGVGSELT